MPSFTPRYDRIASLVLVVVLGLAVVLVVDINPNILQAQLGGDIPAITVSWVLIAALVVITSTGADLLVRGHPSMQTRTLPTLNLGVAKVDLAPGFWILPSFSVIGSFALFRLFHERMQATAFVTSLVVAGGALLVVLVSQLYALDREPATHQRARLVLHIVTYLVAYSCFSAIYSARFRTLYAAALIGATGMLLAFEVLQWTQRKGNLLLAAMVGLLLGEATWALNYWPTHYLSGGALLVVIFYLAVSLLWHHSTRTLRRALLAEYGLLGGALLAVIIYTTLKGAS
ncbi:MAG: hypothetical protein HC884_10655 [Chloroflexaceae bacterium]|nr:hypothetical protein [Chloroflexaceae bacterium]